MIDPNREYSIKEVVNLRLIPGVKGYAKVYNLITQKEWDDMGRERKKSVEETTRTSIKPEKNRVPGNKIHSKHYIKGSEIIKFLKLNSI
jgi:hypothetical protein